MLQKMYKIIILWF